MRQYVSLRFRTDTPSENADKLAVAIANGESELAQMELYHKAREARDLERRLDREGAAADSTTTSSDSSGDSKVRSSSS
jgi:hypothetical protein